ncbi:DUF4260 domain-containing protein [Halioxenophilus sp. WMMB6]|uniref:DUF4260 domain-containing protein n=1 Tax=Halioxenophilus sp. WMMB6 TaxID=3073815 RepID=UPI00295EB9AF|nr:DUF4260 domain-containing protein [Halioxenophilus sp. WMMB6]
MLAEGKGFCGAVVAGPKLLLRLEGLLVLMAGVVLFARLEFSWSIFGWCFLLPDIAMAGYLINSRIGAAAYNCTHSYIGPLLLLLIGFTFNIYPLMAAGSIWLAHIGFDRALGYGLKYAQGFGYTHLGTIGNASRKVKRTGG